MKASKPPTETAEHRTVAAYFAKIGLADNAIAFHVRNERHGDGQRLLAGKMGILPGLPDWLIIHRGRVGAIEIKPRGWKARKQRTDNFTPHETKQLVTHDKLLAAGCWVEICETLEEILDSLVQHGVPLRNESITTERIRKGITAAMMETVK